MNKGMNNIYFKENTWKWYSAIWVSFIHKEIIWNLQGAGPYADGTRL